MLTALAKFSVFIGAHVVIASAWKRYSGAAWGVLLFSLVAFSINFLIRIPLSQLISVLLKPGDLFMLLEVPFWVTFVAQWLVLGIVREGVRWVTFRHIATSVRGWRDGVMFGLGYSFLTTLSVLGDRFPDSLKDPVLPPHSIAGAVEMMNDDFLWVAIPFLFSSTVVSTTIFNVGTSLAVLYSVQRQRPWFMLVAIALYVLFVSTATFSAFNLVGVELPGIRSGWSFMYVREIAQFVTALPPLALTMFLRKRMNSETIGVPAQP